MDDTQTVVIVGGGFAGLELIKRLGDDKRYNLILVDANNYNFFPPLIYQVSAGFMEPSAISYPFRKILRKHKNTRFRLGAGAEDELEFDAAPYLEEVVLPL